MNSDAMVPDSSTPMLEPMNSVAITMQMSKAPMVHRLMAQCISRALRDRVSISFRDPLFLARCAIVADVFQRAKTIDDATQAVYQHAQNPAMPVSRKTGATASWMT